MHNQRYKAKYGEEHASAARDFTPDLQCEHRAGEQEEHAYPSQADRAYLIAQDQQFGWSVHSADFHQRNEQSRDENCRAEVLADIAGRIPLLKMIRKAGKHAGKNDRREVGYYRERLHGIIMDRPFAPCVRL